MDDESSTHSRIKMIWSKYCIDETKGFDLVEQTKTLKPRKIGRYVLTLEECNEILKKRMY
jgi:hypothetical protein